MNCNINNFSGNPDESFVPNDIANGNADLLVKDNLVITIDGTRSGVHFLDISNPSRPKSLDVSFEPNSHLHELTISGDIILFGLEYQNMSHSILKIDLSVSSTAYTEIDFWNKWLQGLSFTNDTLYSFSMDFYLGLNEFLIFNATNFDNLSLLGNTTLNDFELGPNFVVHDDFVYFSSYGKNLSIFQINSSYQLTFIHDYVFGHWKSIYFYDNYLYTCSDIGLQVYDYSNPSNLSLITYYNISSAQHIRIRNDVAYLTTSDSFTILDLSNIFTPQILDQYIIGENEYAEMWKIELSDNLAIILTQEMRIFDYPRLFGGYLYIFDIGFPTEINRLYPRRLPSLDGFTFSMILIITAVVSILLIIIVIFILSVRKDVQKKKLQKKKELI